MLPRTGGRRAWLAILGLSPSADLQAVKDAYRKLVLKHHPDVTGGGESETLRSIVQAYEGLTSSSVDSSTDDERGVAARHEDDPAVQARWNVRRRMRPREFPDWFYEEQVKKPS